jgi:hypothetical protein
MAELTAKVPTSPILPGCNVLNTRAGSSHYIKHIQKASQSPLDLDTLASAVGILVEKNEIWSGRSDMAGFAVRAGIDETASSHDRCGLKGFYCNEDAIQNVAEYAMKICRESSMSEACLILAAIYTDRIQQHVSISYEETFLLQKATVRRLLLVASFIASKIYDVDAPEDMWRISKWAAIGEMSPEDLRTLEQRFLSHSLEFSLYVHWQEFEFKRSLMEELCKGARPRVPPLVPAMTSEASAAATAGAMESLVLGDGPSGFDIYHPAPTGPLLSRPGYAQFEGPFA